MCLSDDKHPKANLELTIVHKNSETSYHLWKWKTGHNINQANSLQNSRLTISNANCDFKPLASIIAERFDNIKIKWIEQLSQKDTKQKCQ